MPTKRPRARKRQPWTKQDVRELKEHSRSKSPLKKNRECYEAHDHRASSESA
jgi:hypothetical protein